MIPNDCPVFLGSTQFCWKVQRLHRRPLQCCAPQADGCQSWRYGDGLNMVQTTKRVKPNGSFSLLHQEVNWIKVINVKSGFSHCGWGKVSLSYPAGVVMAWKLLQLTEWTSHKQTHMDVDASTAWDVPKSGQRCLMMESYKAWRPHGLRRSCFLKSCANETWRIHPRVYRIGRSQTSQVLVRIVFEKFDKSVFIVCLKPLWWGDTIRFGCVWKRGMPVIPLK